MIVDRFIPKHPLKTAVLFLIYKRLDTTKKVFEVIRKAKPPKLYIASDGPKSGEEIKIEEVRNYVLNNIDFKCEIKTLFREKNLGCKMAVSSAISWFFNQEEKGIILEDDTVPSLSFFWFCEELLNRYSTELKIGHIAGCNFQDGIRRGNADYYFSIYNHIWGWASWANRWQNYDVFLENFIDSSFIDELIDDKRARKYWKSMFKNMKAQKFDTWDYQWTFTLWKNKQLSVIPNVNMVTNIGFGDEASHNKIDTVNCANIKRFELILTSHPENIKVDKDADEYTMKRVFKPFLIRAFNKTIRFIFNKFK